MPRRWDTDERGYGVATATWMQPELDRLREAAGWEDWVAEEPQAHLMRRLGDSPFDTHGHTVRLIVEPAETPEGS